MKVIIPEGTYEVSTMNEVDRIIYENGYERIRGNCNEWCVGKLHKLNNKESYYICGSIQDDNGNNIKGSAVLNIKSSERLSYDIWQSEDNFNEEEWNEAIKSFASNLQDIYDWLDKNEFDMPDRLYVLGDVINMLQNIDVKMERK